MILEKNWIQGGWDIVIQQRWILGFKHVLWFINFLMFFLKRERGIHLPKGGHKHPRKPSNYTLSWSRVLDGRCCAVSVGLNLVPGAAWKRKKWWMPSDLALTLGNHICCLGIVAAATPTKLSNQTSSKQPRLRSLKIWKNTWSWWNLLYSQLSLKGHFLLTNWATRQTPMKNALSA